MKPRVVGMTLATVMLAGIPVATAIGPAQASGGALAPIRQVGASTATPVAHKQPPHQPVAAGHTGNFPYRPVTHRHYAAGVPTAAGSIQTSASAPSTPSTSASYEGVSNNDNSLPVLPPDPNGDVGFDPANGHKYYVQWVNLTYLVFDFASNTKYWVDPTSLFADQQNPCSYDNNGDPVVQFDPSAHRWVFTQFAFDSDFFTGAPQAPYLQCIAVSDTPNPLGTYHSYAWDVGSYGGVDYFPDYPKLSVWPNAYYLTFNFFSGNNLSTFNGPGIVVLDRRAMLAGQPDVTALSTGPMSPSYSSLLPADLDGPSAPPQCSAPNTDGSNCVESFIAADTSVAPNGSNLQVWHLSGLKFASSGGTNAATMSGPTNLPVPTYNWALCNESRNCIKQPGTTAGLDAVSDRLMYRAADRMLAGVEHLVVTQTVNVSQTGGNQAGVRWYDITGVSGTPAVAQVGTYAPDATNRWLGSAAMDQSGDIAIGYSASSTSVFPSIRYAGRLPGDAAGTLGSEQTVIAGAGSQTSASNRWGDYSAMVVDPQDDCTFWYTNEYYTSTTSSTWHTRIGTFSFPGCGTPVSPPSAPATVTAGATSATSVHVTWSAATGATSYSVRRTSNGGTSWTVLGTGLTSTSYDDTAASPTTTYTYAVQATNSGGSSTWTSSNPVTTPSLPATPTNLHVTATTSTSISLAWNAVSGATDYRVYRSKSATTGFTLVATVTTNSYKSTGLSRRTTYYFYVVAHNANGSSLPSSTVSATTPRK